GQLVRFDSFRQLKTASPFPCGWSCNTTSISSEPSPMASNPVVQSIISGNAPTSARSAAARGLLPLAQSDLLAALVHLSTDTEPAIASAAQETLACQQPNELLDVARTDTVA